MIVEIFTYAVIVTVLAGLAAMCVEGLLAEMQRPRRFAWFGAYAVALALPLLSPLWAASAPPAAADLGIATADTLPAYVQIDLNAALLWLWAAATTLLLVLYAAAWARLKWMARRWQRVHSDEASILVAEDVGPAVLGIFGPRVVLPRWLMDAAESTRRMVVAHELEHIAARDQVAIVAAQLIAILLPWNLPLWWFARRLRAAIEIDCDARVLRQGVDPVHYADVLLAVGQHGIPSPYVAATLIEPVTHLERRIRIMLTKRPRSPARAVTAIALTLALAACATKLDPPAVAPRPPPAAVAVNSPMQMEASEMRRSSNGQLITLTAPKIQLGDETTITAERLSVNETDQTLLFEGDVRIDAANTSIRATRVLARTTADGSLAWTFPDAVFASPRADGAKLSE